MYVVLIRWLWWRCRGCSPLQQGLNTYIECEGIHKVSLETLIILIGNIVSMNLKGDYCLFSGCDIQLLLNTWTGYSVGLAYSHHSAMEHLFCRGKGKEEAVFSWTWGEILWPSSLFSPTSRQEKALLLSCFTYGLCERSNLQGWSTLAWYAF